MRHRLLLALLSSATLTAAAPPSLLVLDFQSRGILDRHALEALRERTHELLATRSDYALVPLDTACRRMAEKEITLPPRCDAACYARLASRLGADRLLAPSVERNGDRLRIGYALIRGRDGAKLSEGSTFSDGRVGKAVDEALSRTLEGRTEGGLTPLQWGVTGAFAALGAGAAIFFSMPHSRTGGNRVVSGAVVDTTSF